MPSSVDFRRKNIRLPAARYRGRGLFFITICFRKRREFGRKPKMAAWLVARLGKWAADCEFAVHAYCVMPDHVHFLAAGASDTSNLIKFVEGFKQETAIEFMRRKRVALWQFKYYDHILRLTDSVEGVAWYIWLNPVRKGLCRTPAEYEFAGAFTPVGRKMLSAASSVDWTPPWKEQGCRAEGPPPTGWPRGYVTARSEAERQDRKAEPKERARLPR